MSQKPPPPPLRGGPPPPLSRGRITTPPRLYLITPPVADPAAFAPQLEAALAAGDVAAVLLRLAEADERTLINRTKILAETVQRRDVALLLDNRPGIVARAGADGAHLSGIEAFAAALALLKPDRIAGAGALLSRHDAMLAAETGADYVMFGDPRPPPRGAGSGLPSTKFWSASSGGRSCSKSPASAMRQAATRSLRWRKPAPTSSRWVSGYGPSRTTPPQPSPRPPHTPRRAGAMRAAPAPKRGRGDRA